MCCACRPGGIPARNAKGERLLLYIGVIDILQSYRLKKKLEHAMKAMVHDGVRFHRLYCSNIQGFTVVRKVGKSHKCAKGPSRH